MFISSAGAVAKYCDVYVCLCSCLSVREDISGNHTRDPYQIFVRVAYVRGSVLLKQVDDRPHGLSAARG